MHSPEPVATNADTTENEEIPLKTSETEDLTMKRTVRFANDEEDDYSILSTTNDTKRQRAALLLTALTS